ncbi:MAG: glycosyltransferase family 2 protein [Planctomycetes bacterium]|nr:glycosyltransferase family 2 protein [Planctomycetota bacterium]
MGDIAPTVSVILPTYNRADVLERAVKIVTDQTWRPLQLVLVNDGSSDDTQSVMAALEAKVREARVEPTFINKPNGGCASARNLAMQHVTGDYFAFLDDDDLWYPEKLAKQVAELQRTGADGCCCQVVRLSEGGAKRRLMPPDAAMLMRGREPGKFIDRRADAHLITIVLRTSKRGEVGEFNTTMRTWSDTEWIIRALHVADFCAVGEVLGEYVFNDKSLSRFEGFEELFKRDGYQDLALKLIKDNNKQRDNWDEAAWRRRVSQDYDEFIKHRLYAGDLDGARKCYEEAVSLAGDASLFARTRRKMRKAWWLSLIGKKLQHPKFGAGEMIRG